VGVSVGKGNRVGRHQFAQHCKDGEEKTKKIIVLGLVLILLSQAAHAEQKMFCEKKTAPGSGTAKLTHSLVDVIRHKKRRGEGGREGGKQGRERGDKVDVYTRRGLTDD
jgi:hypothetical protein